MAYSNDIIKKEELNERVRINVKELVDILLKKTPKIFMVGVIFSVLLFSISKFFMTPQYIAETKVYVLNNETNNNNMGVTAGDLQVGSYLTKDYMELVKSRPVLEYAINKVGLNITTEQLKRMISLESPADTRILCIKVTHNNPEIAMDIANAVREAAGKQICEIMNADAVNVVEKAELPTIPASPNIMKNTILGALLGIFISVTFFVIKYISDDTIKDSKDVEKYLGLTTLTMIPTLDDDTKKKKSKKNKKRK